MKQDFNAKKEQIIFGNDAIVIREFISGLEGGRTLDMTGFTDKVVKAGHVIITDGKGSYKPMPVTGTGETATYGELPANHSYAGILYRSILVAEPAASVMTWGIVNEVAVPYPMTTIKEAFMTACPHIDFTKDEEA